MARYGTKDDRRVEREFEHERAHGAKPGRDRYVRAYDNDRGHVTTAFSPNERKRLASQGSAYPEMAPRADMQNRTSGEEKKRNNRRILEEAFRKANRSRK